MTNQDLANFIWQIANLLRGPYRPPQYERVMLPLVVLRRFDCVLADTKSAVIKKYNKMIESGQTPHDAILNKVAGGTENPDLSFHNHSELDFEKLKGDPDAIASHLQQYIDGFSENVRKIFERFEFTKEIEKLAEANRLYLVVSKFVDVDLSPDKVDNITMGLLFEDLIRRFNEAANETAGDLEPQDKINGRFLNYFLLCPPVIAAIDNSTFGSKMPRANWDFIGDLKLPLPSLCLQQRIAAYLDRETFAIDTLIAEKEAMLGLLEEKRRALFSHAVTQGLDPKAKMKPTSIEWFGKVPSHWKVERLKFQLLQSIDQGWSPTCENRRANDDEWAVLKVGCVNGDRFDPQEHKALQTEHEPPTRFEIREGDILLSRGNTLELVGSASVVPRIRSKLLLCDLLYRFRVNPEVLDPRFAVLQLRSKIGRFQLEREANGTSGSMKKIGQDSIQNFVVLTPPRAEQDRILAAVEIETSRMDTIRNVTLDSIRLLRERRSALITAAVTGQIKL